MRRPRFQSVGFVLLSSLLPAMARAEIIDRVSLVVGRQVVKSSDIEKDVRVTSFLNGVEPSFTASARKQAANRLIDQALIREQVRTGQYPRASLEDARNLLASLRKQRFHSDAEYRNALARYGIDEEELRDRLLWQLTVLRFIDARFRPEVALSDQEVQNYYLAHSTALRKAHPEAKTAADLQAQARQVLEGEKVNNLLNAWLDQSRKETRIEYVERSLQ